MILTSWNVDIPRVGSTVCRRQLLKSLASWIGAGKNTTVGLSVENKHYNNDIHLYNDETIISYLNYISGTTSITDQEIWGLDNF